MWFLRFSLLFISWFFGCSITIKKDDELLFDFQFLFWLNWLKFISIFIQPFFIIKMMPCYVWEVWFLLAFFLLGIWYWIEFLIIFIGKRKEENDDSINWFRLCHATFGVLSSIPVYYQFQLSDWIHLFYNMNIITFSKLKHAIVFKLIDSIEFPMI